MIEICLTFLINISKSYLKQNRISEIKPEDVEELVEEDVIEPIDLPEDLDATPTEEYIFMGKKKI